MVESRNRTIRDYFGSSQSRPVKRSLPSDGAEEGPVIFTFASSPPIAPPAPIPATAAPRDDDDDLQQGAGVLSTSQAHMLISSQRIVKNGEVVIRNSDDESGSDTSSLEDLEHLLHRKRNQSSSSREPELPYLGLGWQNEDRTCVGKRMLRGERSLEAFQTFPSLPVRSTNSLSLGALAKHRKQYDASKESVARVNARLEAYKQHQEMSMDRSRSEKAAVDTKLIDSVVKQHGDADHLDRLKIAIQRTEALDPGKSWSFFDEDHADSEVAIGAVPRVVEERLASLLNETPSCQKSFLGGFIGEYARRKSLPEELLLWILDAACLEARDDMRQSYISTLMEASEQIAPLLTPHRIDEMFKKLGAKHVALQGNCPIVPHLALEEVTQPVSRPRVVSVLELFRDISPYLSPDARRHAICLLCRLILDRNVFNDHHLLVAAEETMTHLLHYHFQPYGLAQEKEVS